MNSYKFIDCHSHPYDSMYDKQGIDIDQKLSELKELGGATIAIGTDYENTKKAIMLAQKHENVFATIGIHPADNHAENYDEKKFEELLELGKGKVVGIGECGLDYFYFAKRGLSAEEIENEKARQKSIFQDQIEFAKKHNLPLVIHGRPTANSMDAYRDILDILEAHTGLRGHAHFFVGNQEITDRFLKLGFLLSFDGPITFSAEYDNVIKNIPLESIMIETDSPYASPLPHRGKINFPEYVVYVAKKIAELKEVDEDEVLSATMENAKKLFRLSI